MVGKGVQMHCGRGVVGGVKLCGTVGMREISSHEGDSKRNGRPNGGGGEKANIQSRIIL